MMWTLASRWKGKPKSLNLRHHSWKRSKKKMKIKIVICDYHSSFLREGRSPAPWPPPWIHSWWEYNHKSSKQSPHLLMYLNTHPVSSVVGVPIADILYLGHIKTPIPSVNMLYCDYPVANVVNVTFSPPPSDYIAAQ